jgi:hypothetical protein
MIITMYVMPPFTYPNLSLYSHRVITVICDLQIFSCPTNEDVKRVHYATSSDIRTSGVLMTLAEADSSAGVAFSITVPCAGSSLPDPA